MTISCRSRILHPSRRRERLGERFLSNNKFHRGDLLRRSMDMLMLTLCNARERDRDDWEALFRSADERFRFVSAFIPENSSLGIIDAIWKG